MFVPIDHPIIGNMKVNGCHIKLFDTFEIRHQHHYWDKITKQYRIFDLGTKI